MRIVEGEPALGGWAGPRQLGNWRGPAVTPAETPLCLLLDLLSDGMTLMAAMHMLGHAHQIVHQINLNLMSRVGTITHKHK